MNAKRLFLLALCLLLLLPCLAGFPAGCEERSKEEMRDLTASCSITLNGKAIDERLTDGEEGSYLKYTGAAIVVEAPEEIGAVYLKYDKTPPEWTMTARGVEGSYPFGRYGFLHEYAETPAGCGNGVTLTFTEETSIADLYVLSKGETPPAFVQVWQPAEGRADIVMFPAHSDDDQLFFAGSAPDAAARGAVMQVCYFTNHWNSHRRPHELLNGLWTCGITRYPVIGELPDLRSTSVEEGLEIWAEEGFTYDGMVRAQTELLRRFKPLIVLGHDENGEYGHGAHMIDSLSLRDAVIAAGDATKYPASAKQYGTWDVPKTYIHLWGENTIDFEIDEPLGFFGGKTAFEVSQEAFYCHISQASSRYGRWMLGTEEQEVRNSREFNTDGTYGPRAYGLWRSTVGEDVEKKDFYENVTLYAEQEREARELLERYENERTELIEKYFKEREEALARREERFERTAKTLTLVCAALGVCTLALAALTVVVLVKNRRQNKR